MSEVKVTDRTENLFAVAAALQQNGRLRSTIYGIDRELYILNQDYTVVIRFTPDQPFAQSFSFEANDYDSNVFKVSDGRIHFVTREGDWIRTKSCRSPRHRPEEVRDIFRRALRPPKNQVLVPDEVLKLLDDSLSHVEFDHQDGSLRIRQRDIYSGSVIEVKKRGGRVARQMRIESVEPFGPVGLRTNDFIALYSWTTGLKMFFCGQGVVVFKAVNVEAGNMIGVISQCVYDELGGE